MKRKPISKSGYIKGLQCPLLLWTHYNDYKSIPPPGPATQAIFEIGHRVGKLAQELWPDGVEVPHSWKPEVTHGQTMELFPERRPIFEASFLVDRRYCRVDILEPTDDGAWNLIEVKAGTRVKGVNEHDVAFQADTLRRAGVELNELYLMHVDNRYLRQGAIDPEAYFHQEPVTKVAQALQDAAGAQVDEMLEIMDGPKPEVPIGPHCDKPYECPLKEQCWGNVPDNSPLDLYRFDKAKAFEHIHAGRTSLLHVPEAELNEIQRIQQQATSNGKARANPAGLKQWLGRLVYPVHHLDFETMAPAIPLFDGTRPYQRIPFQFSLHIQDAPGSAPRHLEYLHVPSDDPTTPISAGHDPRSALIEALEQIGPKGSILVYNMSFERSVLEELARTYPEKADFLVGLVARMEDLILPFRAFDLYHPEQRGSCSIKKVLPAFTDLSYDEMEIQAGDQASLEYAQFVYGEKPSEGREKLLEALKEYCRLDTQAMVELLGVVSEHAEGQTSLP